MSGIWPGTTRCIVMLGFDVDGVSSAIYHDRNNARLPSLMSLREYGPSIAVPRILEMLERHKVPASFYIPGYVAETHEELVLDIFNHGHEVGHHGYMHEPPSDLDRDEEAAVLDRGSDILERITGERPRGYRSPSWDLSEYSLPLLAERGFTYDSSLMGDDAPYMVEANGSQLVEIPVHWEWDDYPYFGYDRHAGWEGRPSNPDDVYSAWAAGFEGAHYYGRAFTLTMHPYIIGRPGRLRMLERLVRYMRGFQGVEFMRAIDVADMWAAKHEGRLQR